ncbi:MAG: PAS-domain containing protein [Shimia sp.]
MSTRYLPFDLPSALPSVPMDMAVIGFAALVTGTLLGALALGRIATRAAGAVPALDAGGDGIAFLFDGDRLIDATPDAEALLAGFPRDATDLRRVIRGLAPRFDGIETVLDDGASTAPATGRFPARTGVAHLTVDRWDGFARMALSTTGAGVADDPLSRAVEMDELGRLRDVTEEAPLVIWTTGAEGRVDWANEAYLALCRKARGTPDAGWPPPALFAPDDAADPAPQRRVAVTGEDGVPMWFDVHRVDVGGRAQFYAHRVDRMIASEDQRKQFVQTLTKTFANLSVGLAIFDAKRELVLFNPALLDLLELPFSFLSGRPTLARLVDELRDRQVIGEPKDYKAWRRKLAEFEATDDDAIYSETWPLPGGLTFRVTGRPHPDGAIAFTFEDISAELAMSRRFRAEIEQGHAMLDLMEEAVVVFSRSGALVFSNEAYRKMWGSSFDTQLLERRVEEEIALWGDRIGDDLDRIAGPLVRGSGRHRALTRDRTGQPVAMRLEPLRGGHRMVGFTRIETETSPMEGVIRSARRPAEMPARG